jgi:hypothetical protein
MAFYSTGPQNERIFTNLVPMDFKVMSRGSVAVKVNDNIGHYFQIRKECIKEILCLPSFLT